MNITANDKSVDSVLTSRAFHIVLLIVGTVFLSLNAFHNNVWFDESYSVAIANHDFGDIWYIGSGDVHPVLYYWGLHVLYIIFGQNLVAYRLATLLGVAAVAWLGFVCLRKDFSAKIGVLFSFLVLTMPYVTIMATEIRMYSWVFFTVSVCALFSFRIAQSLSLRVSIPYRWWVVFFLSSLASAYLHYFGVLTAFLINAMFLCFLLRHRVGNKRIILTFIVQALVQVLLYLPWLSVLLNQVGVVSESYWANISPETVFNLLTYLVATDNMCFAWRGEYGLEAQIAMVVLLCTFLVICFVFLCSLYKRKKQKTNREDSSFVDDRADIKAACLAFGLYIGVIVLSLIVSAVMDSFILYYRYAFVASAPFLFALSVLLSRIKPQLVARLLCALMLCVAITNQVILLRDNYSSENNEALEYFEEQAKDGALVLSSDIGVEGVTCVAYPEIEETYLDWQEGNWAQSYLAYAPSLKSVKTWDAALDGYKGIFIVLGQSPKGEEPSDVNDLVRRNDVSLVEFERFYRPYERTYFTVALLEKV